MKIEVAYHPCFCEMDINKKAEPIEMRATIESQVMDRLKRVTITPESNLLQICFLVDVPVKTITASMIILACIKKKFPDYRPNGMFIHVVPSPLLSIEIEFGGFRDIGKSFR